MFFRRCRVLRRNNVGVDRGARNGEDTAMATELRSVLIVDDHQTFAQALSMVIDHQPDMTSLGSVGAAESALHRISADHPDVVLLDIGLPGRDGIAVVPDIRELSPDSQVLLLTGDYRPSVVARANAAGVDAVLRKSDPLANLIEAIRMSTDTAAERIGPAGRLTDRELEVLTLLSRGETVTAIARSLGITVNTCRGYVRTILEKLGAHSQLAAVVRAERLGLLTRYRGAP
jgi:DNA-binding NarL/FixJ family response regulator